LSGNRRLEARICLSKDKGSMASFYIIRGRDHGQHFAIRGQVTSVGRESSNPIKLNDTEVSRKHAVVIRTDEDQFEIEDNASSNGTLVNGQRIQRQVLHSGDRVQMGRTLMVFTGGPDPHVAKSVENVEIVSQRHADELSEIRSSIESQAIGEVRSSGAGILSPSLNPTFNESMDERSPAATPRGSFPRESAEQPRESQHSSDAEWEIVYQVSQAITRTVDLDELLKQVLELIFQWVRCDRGCVMMFDDDTGELVPKASRRRTPEIASSQTDEVQPRGRSRVHTLQISRSILEHVLESREGVLTSNAQNDARWMNVESIESLGVHEALCVPMLGRYGLVGAIYVDTRRTAGQFVEQRQQHCFNEPHLKLLLSIAQQAALAVEDTQFYQAMLQSERLATMGQTIANLSHHVKNILQGISGGSFLVKDGLCKQDLEVVGKGWSIVEKNQARISNLVMDMLSFSKERMAEQQPGDLHALLSEVVDLMRGRAVEVGVELVGPESRDELIVSFDAEAMHRAVLNVVTNAIDAAALSEQSDTPDSVDTPCGGGCVTLSAARDEQKRLARIEVHDNGGGIAESDIARIFSPFESTKGARGTGLGLPVSLKILREHGGDIHVDSRVGEGTTFILSWPLTPVGGGGLSSPADHETLRE
jgi:two-component system, NtrC family, sensor kinase